MKLKVIRIFLFLLSGFIILQLTACGGGGDVATTASPGVKFSGDDNQITQFSFSAIGNKSTLSSDISGTISGTQITCSVPKNTDVKNLVADYLTNSKKITVNDLEQVNGLTANDFSSPIAYKVYASDGSFQEYTVTVNFLPASDKSITAYSLGSAEGTIDQSAGTIKVTLPPKSDKKSQIAAFSISGVSAAVNGVDQVSGVTDNNFSSSVEYTVKAEDGSTRTYTVTVDVTPSSEKDITSFAFRSAENSILGSDVTGVITSDSITAVIPYSKTPSYLLKAYFQTTGASVTVNGTAQVSASTENNFSSTVTYRVTAENGSTHDYTVTVTMAKSTSKEITSYSLAGERGAIDANAKTISVAFPANKTLTSLIAAFSTTGASVLVSGTEQVSGTTANDFTSPVVYTVKAEDGSEQTYTVKATKTADIPGVWNFDSIAGEGYTVSGAALVPGLDGYALEFDGVNDYVLIKDSADLTLATAGTLEVIFKIKAYNPYAGLVHKGVQPDFRDESYNLQFWTGNILRMILTNDAGRTAHLDTTSALLLEKWYHVVATWDADKLNMYVNGILISTKKNTIGSIRDSEGGLVIGAQLADQLYNNTNGNFCFNGIIDRVGTYNRAITAEEAASHYNLFFPVQGSGLAAYIPRAGSINFIIILTAAVLIFAAIILVRRFGIKSGLNE